VRSSLALLCFENLFIGINPASLRTRNQPGLQRSKFCDLQIAFQGLTRKIGFGNSKSGALALKGFVQVIRYTQCQSAHVLQCTTVAVQAALSRDYDPMTKVFRVVITRTLKSVAKTSSV